MGARARYACGADFSSLYFAPPLTHLGDASNPPKSRTNNTGKRAYRCGSPDAAVLAAERGEEEVVLAWLEGGGRADAKCERYGLSGLTLLMLAANCGHERVVELLIRRSTCRATAAPR